MTTPTIPFYPVTHDDGTSIVSALNNIASARRMPIVVADAFSTLESYDIGDYVIYENNMYRFTSAHSIGAWDNTQVVRVTVGEELEDLSENQNLINSNISDDFDTTITYKIGDIVRYNNSLYKFISDHSAGTWIGTDAMQITIDDELFSLDIKGKNILTANDNLDNLFTGGIYYGSGASTPLNAPTDVGISHFAVIVINGKELYDEVLQIYYTFGGGIIREWKRRWSNTWGSWNKFYNKSEIEGLFTMTSHQIVVKNLVGYSTQSVASQTISNNGYKPIFFSIIPGGWGDLCSWSWGEMAISGNNVVTGTGYVHNNVETTWNNVYIFIKILWMKI